MSVTSRVVEAKAPKGGHLTLADLKEFASTLEQAGAALTTPIDGSVTFGGHLKGLKARAVRFGDGLGGRGDTTP